VEPAESSNLNKEGVREVNYTWVGAGKKECKKDQGGKGFTKESIGEIKREHSWRAMDFILWGRENGVCKMPKKSPGEKGAATPTKRC